jgi:hypothetical protein
MGLLRLKMHERFEEMKEDAQMGIAASSIPVDEMRRMTRAV